MNNTKIETTVDILFFAFRYALSRKTGLDMFLIPELEKNKNKFLLVERRQIISEIEERARLYDVNDGWKLFAEKWNKEFNQKIKGELC